MFTSRSSGCTIVLAACLIAGCSTSPISTDSDGVEHSENVRTVNHAATPEQVSDEEIAIWKRLDDLVDVDFNKTPLLAICDWWRDAAKVNVVVNWGALEASGIEQDLPITLKLKQASLREVMALVLELASGGAQLEPIDFAVQSNLVRISTRRDLTKEMITRHYNVRDLIDCPVTQRVTVSDRKMAGDSIELSTFKPFIADREEAVEAIVVAISDAIRGPYVWDWSGFGGAVLREEDGILIIKSFAQDHGTIARLLTAFRRQREALLARNVQDVAITPLLKEANAKRLAGQHEAALRMTQRALLIRPDHPVALAMQRVLAGAMHRRGQSELVTQITRSTAHAGETIKPLSWQWIVDTKAEDDANLPEVTREKLAKRISVNFKQATLAEALTEIAQQSDLNIVPIWERIEISGITIEDRITFQVSNMPTSEVMQLLIEHLPSNSDRDPIAADVRGHIVRMTTARREYGDTLSRAYDVEDLFHWPPRGAGEIDALLNDEIRPSPRAAGKTRAVDLDATSVIHWIPDLIRDTIADQEKWAAYGGTATITNWSSLIIVSAPHAVHEEIVALLEHLRGQMVEKIVFTFSEQEIAGHLEDSLHHVRLQKFDVALTSVNRALIVNPDHAKALAMQKTLTDIIARQRLVAE